MENIENNKKTIYEINSRWYQFQFYDDHFTCQYKMNFRKHNETVYYRDIENIDFLNASINFTKCYTYTIKLKNGKKIKLVANYESQLLDLRCAIGFVQELTNKSKVTDTIKENSIYKDGKYYFF